MKQTLYRLVTVVMITRRPKIVTLKNVRYHRPNHIYNTSRGTFSGIYSDPKKMQDMTIAKGNMLPRQKVNIIFHISPQSAQSKGQL